MKRMTPRARIELAINHKEPDRVPLDIGSTANHFTNGLFFKLKQHLGIQGTDINMRPDESAAYYNEELLEALGGDFRHLFLMPPDTADWTPDEQGVTTNEWGFQKKNVNGLVEIINAPLKGATIDDLEKYNWPNPYDPGRVRGLKARAVHLYHNTDYAIATRAVSHGFFELSYELRGFEQFLMDLHVDKSFANALMDKVLDIHMKLHEVLLKDIGAYVQIVEMADDYGMQTDMLMSPKVWREFIKPRRKELIAFVKTLAPKAKIFHHSCGSIYRIIEDMIEIGVDILNPVQPLATGMDSLTLKKEFGDRLCFHGGIDEQLALPGDPELLVQEIQTRIDAFAPGGGYIIGPTSNIQDDTPVENVLLYIKTAKEYGRYS